MDNYKIYTGATPAIDDTLKNKIQQNEQKT